MIVRECTARAAGGVSVLSLEGAGALEGLRALAPGLPPTLVPGRPTLVRLVQAGEPLDEALALQRGPERIELHLHGSRPLVERLLVRLAGEPPPEPGPEPGLEQRAWQRLAHAPGEAAARILLDQAEGALRRELEALSALSPLSPGAREQRVARLLERGRIAAFALRPYQVVLAGPVNAGKSTLFNVLFGRRRVVTSELEGTTRDAIVESVRLGAWPIELWDTAGEREARGLEAAGQRLGDAARRAADLILRLAPADAPLPAAQPADRDAPPVVLLTPRADLVGERELQARPYPLSALGDPEGARRTVELAWREAFDLPLDPWEPGAGVPFEAEHLSLLEALVGPPPGRVRALADLARLLAAGPRIAPHESSAKLRRS